MIEPTESEPLAELDRFCDAMIAIRQEVAEIEGGAMELEASPLRHAPHTVQDLIDPDWSRSYPRAAATPGRNAAGNRYWPAVNRVDNGYGDRNLVCTCPPIESYAQAAE